MEVDCEFLICRREIGRYMDLYSSVYTEGSVGCNAMRGIGYKYSLRPLFWPEVKEVFSKGVSEFVSNASVYEE